MNNSGHKAKLSLVSSQKNPVKKVSEEFAAPNTVSSEEASLEQLATVDFWKNEISGLKSEKFDSMPQAVERVIDQVMSRMKLNDSSPEDVKVFLRLVFESSESLQTALRQTLKIS